MTKSRQKRAKSLWPDIAEKKQNGLLSNVKDNMQISVYFCSVAFIQNHICLSACLHNGRSQFCQMIIFLTIPHFNVLVNATIVKWLLTQCKISCS